MIDAAQDKADSFLEFAALTDHDFREVWRAAGPDERVEVRSLLFEDALIYHPESGVSNSSNSNLATRLEELAVKRKVMVRPERFELPTCCSGGNRSIQLSYGRTGASSLHAGGRERQ